MTASSISLASVLAALVIASTPGAAQPSVEIGAGGSLPVDQTLNPGLDANVAFDWLHGVHAFGVSLELNTASIDDNAYFDESVVVSVEDSQLRRFRLLARARTQPIADLPRFHLGIGVGAEYRSVSYSESFFDPGVPTMSDRFEKNQIGLAVAPSVIVDLRGDQMLALQFGMTISAHGERRVPNGEAKERDVELNARLVFRPLR